MLSKAHGDDIYAMTDCITKYIHFCFDNSIRARAVQGFPINKPWINSNLKELLKNRTRALLESIQRKLKVRTLDAQGEA